MEAGAVPVLLPSMAEAGTMADRLDGIVLSGGADVDPARYGEPRHPKTGEPDPDRDRLEFDLVAIADERALPVLAICRGHQVLNVAMGGGLVQHVEDGVHVGDSRRHRSEIRHRMRLDPHSMLGELLGETEVAVNSLHHQAVVTTAPGLRACGWADTEDGLVEAMETPDGRVLSVQCHPEELTATQAWARRLFAAFTARAAERSLKR